MTESGAPHASSDGSRERILARLRAAIERRSTHDPSGHPGPFSGARPEPPAPAFDGFRTMFQSAGGEVVRLGDEAAAAEWIAALPDAHSVCLGTDVGDFASTIPTADPASADLGISRARAAIAETGTLVLDARGGRRVQLLVPTHVILVRVEDIHSTLSEALVDLRDDLPSALGLHSGPSKSADIGQVMVRGVHGPGRVIALVLGPETT